MENPATWNEVEKAIAEADKDAPSIYENLAGKGFLPDNRQEEIEIAITDALVEHHADVQKMMVGTSYVRRIYNKLQEKGFVGQPGFLV